MLLITLLALIVHVKAFGFEGHGLIASMAFDFLSLQVRGKVEEMLPERFKNNTEAAANWADSLKGNSSYSWSFPMHYVNPTNDNPPHYCASLYEIEGDNIVNAIRSFAAKIRSSNKKEATEALLFTIHFVGDLHQPLHVSGTASGGNDISVVFDGKRAKLHGVWDKSMIQKRIESFESPLAYKLSIMNRIKGNFWDDQDKWTSCGLQQFQIQNAFNPQFPYLCPELWAAELNRLNCDLIYRFSMEEDLSKEYYQRSVHLIDKLVAMAAVRLANILNLVISA